MFDRLVPRKNYSSKNNSFLTTPDKYKEHDEFYNTTVNNVDTTQPNNYVNRIVDNYTLTIEDIGTYTLHEPDLDAMPFLDRLYKENDSPINLYSILKTRVFSETPLSKVITPYDVNECFKIILCILYDNIVSSPTYLKYEGQYLTDVIDPTLLVDKEQADLSTVQETKGKANYIKIFDADKNLIEVPNISNIRYDILYFMVHILEIEYCNLFIGYVDEKLIHEFFKTAPQERHCVEDIHPNVYNSEQITYLRSIGLYTIAGISEATKFDQDHDFTWGQEQYNCYVPPIGHYQLFNHHLENYIFVIDDRIIVAHDKLFDPVTRLLFKENKGEYDVEISRYYKVDVNPDILLRTLDKLHNPKFADGEDGKIESSEIYWCLRDLKLDSSEVSTYLISRLIYSIRGCYPEGEEESTNHFHSEKTQNAFTILSTVNFLGELNSERSDMYILVSVISKTLNYLLTYHKYHFSNIKCNSANVNKWYNRENFDDIKFLLRLTSRVISIFRIKGFVTEASILDICLRLM